jgi:hypothetical protein
MTISKLLTAPLTVIVGITGKQGGSVARALIASDKPYRLRGLSRDITKPAAQAFAAQGVEMVHVNLAADKPEDALNVFSGTDIAFVSRTSLHVLRMLTQLWHSAGYDELERISGRGKGKSHLRSGGVIC